MLFPLFVIMQGYGCFNNGNRLILRHNDKLGKITPNMIKTYCMVRNDKVTDDQDRDLPCDIHGQPGRAVRMPRLLLNSQVRLN